MAVPPPPPNNPNGAPPPGQPRGNNSRVVSRRGPALRPSRRTLHFKGQMPNERVIWIQRKHWLFLLLPAWPALLSFIALIVVVGFVGTNSTAGPFLTILALALFLVMTIRWAVIDLTGWVFHFFILTNQRVIASKGFFQPDRREAVLKSVVQVVVQRPNPVLIWLNIGDIAVRVIGAQVDMPGVWRPRVLGDSILAVQEHPEDPDAERPAGPAPTVRSQKLQAALDKLAEPVPMPDAPHPHRAPFFGLLQRKVPIRLFEGEQVVDVIYRHWFILVTRLIPALVIFLVGAVGGTLLRHFGGSGAGDSPTYFLLAGVIIGLGWAVLIYLNFVDDIFVLTTHRVIDIDRLIFILTEYSNDAPFSRVQDIHVEMGLLGNILGFGTIVVETSGRKYPVKMTDIPHALRVMDHIFALINDLKDREGAIAQNKQKKENYKWIATVLGEVLLPVPDVRGLPVLDAIARAHDVGLKLIVEVERPARGSPPGTVLEQRPSPGTTDLPENELRVTLSGRGIPAHTP